MRFEEIRDIGHPMYSRALELYKISFSPNEQRKRRSQDSILADAGYHFALIYDDADFVGIVLSWETEEFIYIEHFCMLPEMRGRGYGERALLEIAEKGKRLYWRSILRRMIYQSAESAFMKDAALLKIRTGTYILRIAVKTPGIRLPL